MAAIGIGVAKGASGILSAFGDTAKLLHAPEHRTKLPRITVQRLKIRDSEEKQSDNLYATKLNIYNRTRQENTGAASLLMVGSNF